MDRSQLGAEAEEARDSDLNTYGECLLLATCSRCRRSVRATPLVHLPTKLTVRIEPVYVSEVVEKTTVCAQLLTSERPTDESNRILPSPTSTLTLVDLALLGLTQ